MKNIFKILLLAITLLAYPSATSYAASGFVSFFATNGYNTNPQTDFTHDTPFVYLNLDIPSGEQAVTSTGWNAPDGSSYFGDNFEAGTSTQRWDTLSHWNSVKQAGTWRVYANYFDSTGLNQVVYTDITVTPEPSTFLLFAFGGLPLYFRHKFNKNIST